MSTLNMGSFSPSYSHMKAQDTSRSPKKPFRSLLIKASVIGTLVFLVMVLVVDQRIQDPVRSTSRVPLKSRRGPTGAVGLFGEHLQKQMSLCDGLGSFKDVVRVGSDEFSVNLQRVDGVRMAGSVYSLYAMKSDGTGSGSDIVSREITNNKEWERGEISWLLDKLDAFAIERSLSKSEMFVLDIGANIGTWSFAIAASGYQVLAFEAMDVNQKALHFSFCANANMSAPQLKENLVLFDTGLGKDTAVCNIFSDPGNMLDGLVSCTQDDPPFSYLRWRQRLNIARLDDICGEQMAKLVGKVGAVKMDTEGMEPWVIEGAQEFFKKTTPKYIITELNESAMKASTNYTALQFINQILSMGYEMRTGGFDQAVWTKEMIESEFAEDKESHLLNLYMTHQ
jgi:FkbM family methyltransferase